MVFLAHRYAAAGEDQVGLGRSGLQRRDRGVEIVGDDAQVYDLATQAFQETRQHETVGVVDLAGLQG